MRREDILTSAMNLTRGNRQKAYGDWAANSADIAAIWSIILGHEVEPRQVGLMMAALKLVRLKRAGHEDSYIDLAGYAALGGESDSTI
jgi:hypothetical protein|tara:strand:+ start:169 stop:432 length:264 start_codon:yes stop_codon:yes gene_type:complete